MKTITISDDVYRKLVAIKGNRTFSQIIDELITRDISRRVEEIIRIATSRPEGVNELERIVKIIREP